MVRYLSNIWQIVLRELLILRRNHIYRFCMVAFPALVVFFFTSLMDDGLPTGMPVGVVDLDNTSTSRSLVRRLDGFQMSEVVAHYPSVSEARRALQRNEIYAFLYIPENMSSDLLASRQPKISFYYSYTTLTSGSLLFRDLKTASMLGSAAVGNTKMRAQGYTDKQIKTFLQPITVSLHPINNPMVNYNMYLSVMLIPGAIMLFVFLISSYSIGTELKFGSSKEWLSMANGNIHVALIGKFLPQFMIFLTMLLFYEYYVIGVLHFTNAGARWVVFALTALTVLASQAFGIFMFGLLPSLRMSMSVCSLWAVLSFTTVGAAFPLSAMDAPIRTIAQLFPLRHYYMIYQTCILNGFPWTDALVHFGALVIFIIMPLFVVHIIRKAMLE